MNTKFLRNALIGLSLLSTVAGGCMAGAPASAGADGSGAYASEAAALPAAVGYSYSAPASADQALDPELIGPADMYFADYGINGFVETAQDHRSTFAVDVDTGSYTVMRNYLTNELLPPPEAVRVEEFINYFDYGYANPAADATFAITFDGAPSPFVAEPNHRLVRVGLQGYAIPAAERQDAVLTFVIDVSGSMQQENRLGLAQRSLKLLVEALRPTDAVGIVIYGSDARVQLPTTSVTEKERILAAIDALGSNGSTNAEAGLQLGYDLAWRNYKPAAINRVVLLSDGVANVGQTGPAAILETIAQYAAQGITLTSVGLGMGNYNDVLMEQLADQGDGFYAYVDTMEEAQKLFVDDLTSTLQTIAKDAKVQVEFNAAAVLGYRLVGYENRDVADDDFRNDEVDAGEIGAGHSVTALYELILADGEVAADTTLATVYLRWQDVTNGEVLEIAQALPLQALHTTFEASSPSFQLATTVAAFGETLRQSPAGHTLALADLLAEAQRVEALLTTSQGANADLTEFVDLVWRAEQLAGFAVEGQ
jgi:Ca-activated chloride channel family protein